MNQLKTKWGEQLNTGKIHSEYPRPTMVRDSFFSLNGEWDYAIGGKEKPSKYDGRILVPFSPESELSGVQKVLQPEEYLHYRKTFTIPEAFIRERVLLHFGAVDQECEVWINGKWIGGHKGGYLPFTFDITDGLKPEDENELTVRVRDLTEKSSHARGKQKLIISHIALLMSAESSTTRMFFFISSPVFFLTRFSFLIKNIFDDRLTCFRIFNQKFCTINIFF